MFDQVKINRFGFYELTNKPNKEELEKYYSKKYYQEDKGNYKKKYTREETLNIQNKISRRYEIIMKLLESNNQAILRFLDIGCGEGWALNFFKQKSWEVLGLDYTDYGVKEHNPEYINDLKLGDIFNNINELVLAKDSFHVLWLDNVLEHVLDPLDLIKKLNKLLKHNGVLVINVPNDFSPIQQYLLKHDYVSNPYWIVYPDHISYFKKDGLIALCKEAGFVPQRIISDFPIDLNLFNPKTNYVKDKKQGEYCHLARVELENFLHNISSEKLNNLYEILADLNIGRNITGFFSKGKEV